MNKKLLSLILTSILILSAIAFQCAAVFGATVTEKKQWPFSLWDDVYVTDEWTDDDLTVIGNDNGITRVSDGKLILGGNGSTEKSCMKLRVKGSCRLRFRICSNNTSFGATVAFSNGTRVLGTISVPVKSEMRNTKVMEFDYIGHESDLYIYSMDRTLWAYILAVDFTDVVVGDVNEDSLLTVEDAAYILKHISGSTDLADKLKYADYDGDGNVDLKDVIKILNYIEDSKYSAEVIEVDTSDGTEVSSYYGLYMALNSPDAKVYVTDDIEMEDRLVLNKGGQSIIGVPKADGSWPVLDFKNMYGGNDIINGKSSDSDVGIKIKSSNNVIENLVVENAHDNGILLKSESATPVTGNRIKNCIIRYNNDSGLQMSTLVYNNIVENVISYRNCDVFTRGSNADGFAVKLGAGIEITTDTAAVAANKNTFINCYAWENGDDAWDSYDNNIQNSRTYNIAYENCMCWGNGTPNIHLGYIDYINGLELDEELPFIRRIAETNPTGYELFKTAYNNKTLCSTSATKEEYGAAADAVLNQKINTDIGELTVTELLDSSNWRGNPNGFKLGSAYSEEICLRSLTNCIVFDHEKKGFDENNAMCNVSLMNCISFDNVRNYKLDDMNITGYENVYGWNGTDSDQMPSGYDITTPADYELKERRIRKAAQVMVRYAAQNKIGKTGIFDTVF